MRIYLIYIRMALVAFAVFSAAGCCLFPPRLSPMQERLLRQSTDVGQYVVPPVPDGKIILLKKGKMLGALVLKNQTVFAGTHFRYSYYYRSDGRGTFTQHEPSKCANGVGTVEVPKGSGKEVPRVPIKFGVFAVGWGPSEEGYGWLLYDHFDREAIGTDDLRICVTSETDISKIVATNQKWIYKGSPSDPGVTASGKPAK